MNIVRNSLIAGVLLLGLAGCLMPFTMHPEMADSGAEAVSSQRCRECHTVIYEEWRQSPHAQAYSKPFFQELTNDYQVTACLDCHAPQSAFDAEPRLRPVFLAEGVNCQSCHLHQGKLQGPTDQHLPFNIHPIQEKNELYRQSALCGKCHQQVLAEYTGSGFTAKTCQECHMPAVTRTIIDNRPWVWAKKEYSFKRHTFAIKEAEKLDGEITLALNLHSQNPPAGQVVIQNVSIPHNIPTGAYGYHALQLTLNLLNDAGETEEKISLYFTQELQSSIKPGERRIIDFEFEDEHQFPWGIQAVLSKDNLNPAHIRVLAETVQLYQ